MFQQIEQPFSDVFFNEPISTSSTTNYIDYAERKSGNLGLILVFFIFVIGIIGFVIWKIKDDKKKQIELEEDNLIENI